MLSDPVSRICPGKELADSSLFIAIAMSVAVFDICKSKDKFGNDVEPLHEYVSGLIRFAADFTYNFYYLSFWAYYIWLQPPKTFRMCGEAPFRESNWFDSINPRWIPPCKGWRWYSQRSTTLVKWLIQKNPGDRTGWPVGCELMLNDVVSLARSIYVDKSNEY